MQPSEDQAETEHQWIARAQAGDKAAFCCLFERHHRRVYALSLRLCQQPNWAEDATQEVFIRVWQKLAEFRGESQFTTWLHRLTVNVVLNFRKQQQRWWQPSQHALDDDSTHGALPEHRLDRLLIKLPLQQRRVFVLFAVEGHQHQEIAELLGISVGTSKAHYHHARKQLQEWLR